MTSEQAAQLIDETLDLVHQRLQDLQAQGPAPALLKVGLQGLGGEGAHGLALVLRRLPEEAGQVLGDVDG